MALLKATSQPSRSLRASVLVALALVLAIVYLGVRALGARSQTVRINAIVVLPLRNASGDPNQQYLADGVTEKLISDLGQISALRVISKTSSMNLVSSHKGLSQITRELGVDGVVDGSVSREGSQIRITAQLADARNGRQLWKHDYVRSLASALDLQSEVAREITEQIRVEVTPQERARLTLTRLVNREAQELYLQGKYFWNRGGFSDHQEAIGCFKKATEKDPSFALAYAGLAACYNYLGQAGTLSYLEAYSKAKTAARKAIELDADLADAHASLAYALIDLDWDWTAAGGEFHRALELNPNSGPVHSDYALYLARLGRSREAISEAEKGLQLDPISLLAHHIVAYCYYGARQYDRAIDQIRKASELNLVAPDSWIHWTLGIIYRDKGNYEKALEEFRIIGDQPHAIGHAGNAYARAGQLKEASQAISKLHDYVQKHGVGTYEIALIYAGLGDKDEAFAWLEKSFKVHDKGLTYLKLDPCVDPLRPDARFQTLLRRVGLGT